MSFKGYSKEQRSKIVACFNSVSDKNTRIVTLTWDGEGLKPTKAETAQQFKVGEKYELQRADEYFNTIVNELEDYGRCYEADIAGECAVSKKQLENVAALCTELAEVLPSFTPYPNLLGLGVNHEQLGFAWDLTSSKSLSGKIMLDCIAFSA